MFFRKVLREMDILAREAKMFCFPFLVGMYPKRKKIPAEEQILFLSEYTLISRSGLVYRKANQKSQKLLLFKRKNGREIIMSVYSP